MALTVSFPRKQTLGCWDFHSGDLLENILGSNTCRRVKEIGLKLLSCSCSRVISWSHRDLWSCDGHSEMFQIEVRGMDSGPFHNQSLGVGCISWEGGGVDNLVWCSFLQPKAISGEGPRCHSQQPLLLETGVISMSVLEDIWEGGEHTVASTTSDKQTLLAKDDAIC